jgi:hypothetical protein
MRGRVTATVNAGTWLRINVERMVFSAPCRIPDKF